MKHCCCLGHCNHCNRNHDRCCAYRCEMCTPSPKEIPLPKFHVGQVVRTNFRNADDHCGVVVHIEYSGVSEWSWNYYVKMCTKDKGTGCIDGIRYHGESLFEAAVLYCRCGHSCCSKLPRDKENVPPPKFHIGQKVRTTNEKVNHCGVVIEIIRAQLHLQKVFNWSCKVKMCKCDRDTSYDCGDGIRHHAETLFEDAPCCDGGYCHLCCCYRNCDCNQNRNHHCNC